MRPIEHKILKKIGKEGITLDGIEEIIDSTSRQEMKKSFPDDCHFQSNRYFAKIIVDSLVRAKRITVDGSKYIKIEPQKAESKEIRENE